MSNQSFASAIRSASSNGADNKKAPGNRGVKVVVDVTVAPGVDTVTATIEGLDPVSGKYFTLLASAAIVAVSTVVLTVYPGIAVAANVSASDVVPDTYRVRFTHSAGTNFTYSASVVELP